MRPRPQSLSLEPHIVVEPHADAELLVVALVWGPRRAVLTVPRALAERIVVRVEGEERLS